MTAGATLLEAGRDAGLLLSANCGGIGVCGRCRVMIHDGQMEPPGDAELGCLSPAALAGGERLACRAQPRSDVTVHLPPAFLGGRQRLQTEGDAPVLAVAPIIRTVAVEPAAPSSSDPAADFRRICNALGPPQGGERWHARPRAVAQLSQLARACDWQLDAHLRGSEIVGFAPQGGRTLGLAIDLGCTKIAAYLMDLRTGEQLEAAGEPNPQIPYGEDLISRLVYADKGPEESRRLAGAVRKAIDELGRKLCRRARFDHGTLADYCIVGNTAMIHLLLDLPVRQLLHAPFIAAIDSDLDPGADELDLVGLPGARVHILPSIGGFVGADHVAMILARDIDLSSEPTIGVDIGTNTEIVLHDARRAMLVSTSVPSGPAFEGGHIRDGMRAAAGAIEAVLLHEGKLRWRTIGRRPPVGLCGSGVIDLVAQLSQARLIDERGHLNRDGASVRQGEHGRELVLVPAAESGHGRDIVFTQNDVSEVQLAKAAIRAGIDSLLEITGTPVDAIANLEVAGAFGTHLDLASAVAIGLLPRLPNAHYRQVGNAAGVGARMALLSTDARQRARRIAANARRIELKDHTNFNRLLARATRFPAAAATARERFQ